NAELRVSLWALLDGPAVLQPRSKRSWPGGAKVKEHAMSHKLNAQSPRSASKSARTRSTWQGRTSVMRCTAKQAQARNQVSLHAIRAGEGGREFRQSPPFERFAAYRRATTSRELCSARFLLSRCPLWVRSGGDDRDRPASDVRFAPKADITAGLSESPLCAKSRHSRSCFANTGGWDCVLASAWPAKF